MKNKTDLAGMTICVTAAVVLCISSASAQKAGKDIPVLAPVITAEQAAEAVTQALPKMTVGKYWVWTGKRGDTKAKVALTLDGNIISGIELNPATGEILAKGQDVFANPVSIDKGKFINMVRQSLPNLQVIAARLDKDGEWKVELALNKTVVAEVDVNSRDGTLLTDWGASREATLY
jgi:uncharacterized membrane protein YkoI